MNFSKAIITIFGAALAIAGLGGVPIYVVERDLLRVGVYTGLLIAGIVILGYSAKE
ncbi:hypothetical protein KY338_06425 [Candidatus Woesearchaeota archaeon]|nr:hypothetical protein [Candidatus Woesearchaeota archaeon]MBW3006458.1 hypothetical protein [Candidatus Woesearchaeota archaeon]